jgi:hypothetical protein
MVRPVWYIVKKSRRPGSVIGREDHGGIRLTSAAAAVIALPTMMY